jgi:hypothetical protein
MSRHCGPRGEPEDQTSSGIPVPAKSGSRVDPHTQMNTPVLLLTYNRPDKTQRVLQAIRAAQPRNLFVASDGARSDRPDDPSLIEQTRRLIDEGIDWQCEVKRRYLTTNQGCRMGVFAAISWFFEQVEGGIILEDDCVPHPEFFAYCSELLDRYRHESQVMSIAGDNSADLRPTDSTCSYGFARQPLIWGWATWRRAWQMYDIELDGWRQIRSNASRKAELWPNRAERKWRESIFDRLLIDGTPDTWDYQWSLTLAIHEGLSITPAVNLVSNIGFGEGATHTTESGSTRACVPANAILPLRHPAQVFRDTGLEQQIFDRIHGGAALRRPLRQRVRKMLRARKKSLMALLSSHAPTWIKSWIKFLRQINTPLGRS